LSPSPGGRAVGRRESALLRAVGASRRQILVSVVAEAAAVGVLATAAGLAGGIGLAALLKGAFAGLGFDLPATGLVFAASTAAGGAARGGGRRHPGTPRARMVAGGTVTLAGAALALAGLGGGDSAPALAGIGAVLTTAGAVIIGPAILGPVSAIVGAPATLRGGYEPASSASAPGVHSGGRRCCSA
jgi:putative ABC transport system permease protein